MDYAFEVDGIIVMCLIVNRLIVAIRSVNNPERIIFYRESICEKIRFINLFNLTTSQLHSSDHRIAQLNAFDIYYSPGTVRFAVITAAMIDKC